jgi:hypothetical protein
MHGAVMLGHNAACGQEVNAVRLYSYDE